MGSTSSSDSLRSSPRILLGTFSILSSSSSSVPMLSVEFTTLFFFSVVIGDTDLERDLDLEGLLECEVGRDLEREIDCDLDLDFDLDIERDIDFDLDLELDEDLEL